MITVRGVSTPELTQVGYLIAGDQNEVRDKVVNMFVTCVSLRSDSKRYFPCSITSYLQCAAAHIPVHDSELLIAEYISNEIHFISEKFMCSSYLFKKFVLLISYVRNAINKAISKKYILMCAKQFCFAHMPHAILLCTHTILLCTHVTVVTFF